MYPRMGIVTFCRWEVGKVGRREEFNLQMYAMINYCQRKTILNQVQLTVFRNINDLQNRIFTLPSNLFYYTKYNCSLVNDVRFFVQTMIQGATVK